MATMVSKPQFTQTTSAIDQDAPIRLRHQKCLQSAEFIVVKVTRSMTRKCRQLDENCPHTQHRNRTQVAYALKGRDRLASCRQGLTPRNWPICMAMEPGPTHSPYCRLTHSRYAPLFTLATQPGLSRYHCTVLRMPESKVSAGLQPSSCSILRASIA